MYLSQRTICGGEREWGYGSDSDICRRVKMNILQFSYRTINHYCAIKCAISRVRIIRHRREKSA